MTLRGRRSRGILALLRRPGPGSGGGYGRLDWQKAQERLGPVRNNWDLAILSNLDPKAGRRPRDVLAAVNAQAQTERVLTPQMLSARLRSLEQGGYVEHEDSATVPLRRLYYLRPLGARLIEDLLELSGLPLTGQDG